MHFLGMHSYSAEEVRAFTDFINNQPALKNDPQLAGILAIPHDHDAFFRAFEDGILLWFDILSLCLFSVLISIANDGRVDSSFLLCIRQPLTSSPSRRFDSLLFVSKMVNVAKAGMIDPKHITANRNMSVYHKTQNLNTAIAACQYSSFDGFIFCLAYLNLLSEMGMKLINIGSEDVIKQNVLLLSSHTRSSSHLCFHQRHLVLAIIWQIVRHSLLSHLNLREHPELIVMYEQREDVYESPYHLLV